MNGLIIIIGGVISIGLITRWAMKHEHNKNCETILQMLEQMDGKEIQEIKEYVKGAYM